MEAETAKKELPCSGHEAFRYNAEFLTSREKDEIAGYEIVYYMGKRIALPREELDRTDLYLQINDPVAWRYEVLALLGKGSFSTVYRAFDYKKKEMVALKIVRKDEEYA